MRIHLAVILLMLFSVNIQAQQKKSSDFYNAIKSEPDPVKKEKLLIEWQKQSGAEPEDMPGFNLVDFSRQLVAQAFAEENNIEKAKYWIGRIKDRAGKTNAELNLVMELTSKNKLEQAEKMLLPLYNRLKTETATGTEANPGITPMPTAADCEQLYAAILYKKGKYKKALKYLEPSNEAGRRRENGELYALSLAKAGETDKAIEAVSKMIFAPGHRSDDFETTARKLFIAKFGNDTRFHQLMDSAATISQKKIETKIASMRANEPAPDFELTDLNGKKVSLKSLRGKTVVLDFWATWCQPCVASFPGMQKAVDFYRNDTSVVFMFIHTMEKNDDAVEEVRRFMKYKKYRFDVYMDLRDKATKQSPVVTSYKVKGIPAKFIIDKNGMIRYKNSGYISEEEAIPEIKTMIDAINVAEPSQEQSGFLQELKKALAETDPAKMEKMYEELAKQYKDQHFDMLFFDMARRFAEAGNTSKMLEYYNKVDSLNRPATYFVAIQSLAVSNPKDAEPLLQKLVASLKADLPAVPAIKKAAATGNYRALATLYARTLLENGKPDEAYNYASGLIKEHGNGHAAINDIYILAMLATDRYAEALPAMEESIRSQTASHEIRAKLKDAFLKVKGTGADFNAYEKNLLDDADAKLVEDAVRLAVKFPAEDFVLTDVDGNKVALKELRGKVVVLDFWATWCGPCKASFPAMQQAVDKYKNDPKVKFYFVHTMEKSGTKAATEAKEYISQNNYSFQVLMDFKDKQTGKSPVAESFEVKAIPTKIVIDPDGFVRFKVTGFNMNSEVAVKELSAMIEHARKKS